MSKTMPGFDPLSMTAETIDSIKQRVDGKTKR